MFGRKIQAYIQGLLAMSLLFHINPVSGDCTNTTLKLFDDQIQAIQKSVRTIVENGSCNKKNAPVGFHAYLGSTKTFASGAVWVYDKVVTNTHNAYSTTTGKFTTPEQGLYIFSIDTLCDPGKYSHAGLYVNGKIKTWQACNNGGKSQWLTCSSSAVLLIQKVMSFMLRTIIQPLPLEDCIQILAELNSTKFDNMCICCTDLRK